ncbi:hypothetical protein HRTV-15_gp36 [Halorubrum virus HRTV-15]|nr:hypothetical protein HRTV-15_gp36 [Halorubrum virus HRTV-15]
MDFSSVTNAVSDLSNYVRPDGTPAEEEPEEDQLIEFVTDEELYGAIPEPIPANKVLPDWYKQLGQFIDLEGGSTNEKTRVGASTVKRCAPFMEAMTMGWIIPLAGEVSILAEDGYVQYDWGFHKALIDSHEMAQVGGDMFPNSDWPILKFLNYWCIKAPEGYSLLVTSPFNRIEPRFQSFTGIVDVDRYFNNINAPFMWTGGDYDGVLEAGTPIVQVIPFKRDGIISDARVRPMTDSEELTQKRVQNSLNSHESKYREEWWVHKKGSRNLPPE